MWHLQEPSFTLSHSAIVIQTTSLKPLWVVTPSLAARSVFDALDISDYLVEGVIAFITKFLILGSSIKVSTNLENSSSGSLAQPGADI
jgi:hypothetical protein